LTELTELTEFSSWRIKAQISIRQPQFAEPPSFDIALRKETALTD
jgi:hypothetical protein